LPGSCPVVRHYFPFSEAEIVAFAAGSFNPTAIDGGEMACLVRRMSVVAIATLCGFGTGAASARGPAAGPGDAVCEAPLFTGYTPIFQSGDTLPKEGIFAIALRPVAEIFYFTRSGDTPRMGYGGVVTFENLPAGRYAVVLCQSARVEAVQQRPFLEVAVALRTGGSSCSGSAEITAQGGPLTLQLSGAVDPSILVAVVRLAD
jgi:hypothetical protein